MVRLPDDTLEPVLEPLDGLLLVDAVGGADAGLAASALGDTLTRTGPNFNRQKPYIIHSSLHLYSHAAVEVHAVNTNRRVVLDTQVDVLRDTETEVASLGEVALPQLVLLNLEATLENLLGLRATDGDVDGDLLVTADTEGTDGVAGLACRSSVSAFDLPLAILGCLCKLFLVKWTYCRPGSDQTAARAPWPLSSICHRTRRRRCSGPASGCAAHAWGCCCGPCQSS